MIQFLKRLFNRGVSGDSAGRILACGDPQAPQREIQDRLDEKLRQIQTEQERRDLAERLRVELDEERAEAWGRWVESLGIGCQTDIFTNDSKVWLTVTDSKGCAASFKASHPLYAGHLYEEDRLVRHCLTLSKYLSKEDCA